MLGTADGQCFFLSSSSIPSGFIIGSSPSATEFNEIWKTDRITTSLVGIFNSVSQSVPIPPLGSSPSAFFAKVGSTLFFAADDGSSGTELWALDLDNGTFFTTLEDQGNTILLRRNDGIVYVQVNSDRSLVTSPFGFGAGDTSSEWQMLATETVGGKNQILWRNNTSNFLHVWNLDANWRWQSSYGTIAFNSNDAFALEASFQVDANRNGLIGS